jgi:hypothetical protein
MSPTPIKSCGKARQEVRVETKERDSIALRMGMDGISTTPEYIAFIDQQVASGNFTDAVADEIRTRISESSPKNRRFTYDEFAAALLEAARETSVDAGFQSSFDSLMDFSDAARRSIDGKPRVPLSNREEQEVQSIIQQILRDNIETTDMVLISEIDRALSIIRQKIIDNLGVNLSRVDGSLTKLLGITPMDIEDDGDEVNDESPSDFHMNLDSLGQQLEQDAPDELTLVDLDNPSK